MFTGIVEEIGTVVAVERGPGDARLVLHGPVVTEGTRLGDSIAVDGVCLTVTQIGGPGAQTAAGPEGVPRPHAAPGSQPAADDAPPETGTFWVDVMPETLRRSTLGGLAGGAPVNLERAMRADGRLDGHLVQGHVDGVGTLVSRTPGPRWDDLVVACPPALTRYVAEKGSITVSGVSLTVTHVGGDGFGVSLIPTTLAATTLGTLRPGDRVNLEVDVIAKYVERLLAARLADGPDSGRP